MVYHGKQGNNVIFCIHGRTQWYLYCIHLPWAFWFCCQSPDKLGWQVGTWQKILALIVCVCWQLSKDCAHSWHFGSQCIFLHTKPRAYLYRNYEPWKGDIVAGGWRVYNNELWNTTEWSSGWSDWRTSNKPVCQLCVSRFFAQTTVLLNYWNACCRTPWNTWTAPCLPWATGTRSCSSSSWRWTCWSMRSAEWRLYRENSTSAQASLQKKVPWQLCFKQKRKHIATMSLLH